MGPKGIPRIILTGRACTLFQWSWALAAAMASTTKVVVTKLWMDGGAREEEEELVSDPSGPAIPKAFTALP